MNSTKVTIILILAFIYYCFCPTKVLDSSVVGLFQFPVRLLPIIVPVKVAPVEVFPALNEPSLFTVPLKVKVSSQFVEEPLPFICPLLLIVTEKIPLSSPVYVPSHCPAKADASPPPSSKERLKTITYVTPSSTE